MLGIQFLHSLVVVMWFLCNSLLLLIVSFEKERSSMSFDVFMLAYYLN